MFTRITGLAATGAGLALVIGFAGIVGIHLPDGEVNRYTVPTFFALAPIGLIGVHLRQLPVRPGVAWFGFALAFIGLAWGAISFILSLAGILPQSGGEFGYLGSIALWIGSVALGASMLAAGVFPMPVGLALTVSAPIGMIGLLVRSAPGAGDALQAIAQVAIFVYALAWVGVGLSLVAAQPQEGVLGPATT
jgi:hypothetical protein